jgi:hypothetical protein
MVRAVAAQDAPGSAQCPAGQGYWKSTPTWPLTELTLGAQVYSQAELLILLHTSVEGDASLRLAHPLIAAKLNVANGSDAAVAAGLIGQADSLLSGFAGKLPYAVEPSSSSGQTMVNLGGVLDSYNSGQLTVNCIATTPEATPEMTPEATPEVTAEPDDDLPITIVIEGPVQTVNINLITIFNINIELAKDDPNLAIIQVGDTVRVEGSPQSRDNIIVVAAVTVVVVNVDIHIDTGEVFHDDGTCGNPPPDWAPAHGWRRRCGDSHNPADRGDEDDD